MAAVELTSPASPNCQRWLDRRHSWRHVSDGGFDAARFAVAEIPEAVARAFVCRHHYAGSYPAARFAYGLLTDDETLAVDGTEVDGLALVGVAVLSVPMRASVLSNVFPDLEPFTETLELGRLVLTDTPANAESWFITRVYRMAAERGIRGVVSFADPMPRQRTVTDVDDTGRLRTTTETLTPGHVGALYQATNALSLGRSTARTLAYVPRAGLVLSDRTLSKVRAQEQGSDAAERHLVKLGARTRAAGEDPRAWLRTALDDIGVTKVRHPGNFRYAWTLGPGARRRRARIVLPQTPYPKAETDLLRTVPSVS